MGLFLFWVGEVGRVFLVVSIPALLIFCEKVEDRWVRSVPLRPSAFRGEWFELPRACGISPALYSLRSRSAFAALHCLVEMGWVFLIATIPALLMFFEKR